MDFDLETYLSSNDDSSGFHGDYDIDIDLNFDQFQESIMETSVELKADAPSTEFSHEDNKVESHPHHSIVNESYLNRIHRLTIPSIEITDSIQFEIEKISNPLVVSLSGKPLTSKKSVNTGCKTESKKSLNKTKLEQLSMNALCDEGDMLLHANTVTEMHLNNNCKQCDNICRLYGIPIRHASINSKSFWLMKYLCQDISDVENYAYLKGNILLPKVNKSDDDLTKNLPGMKNKKKCSKVLKMRRSRKICPLVRSSDENNNVTNADGSLESGVVTVDDKVKPWENYSSYPKFKLNYMSSLKERMDRIKDLPLPTKSIELMEDLNVTDCEKLTMPEFFHSDDQTARYLQIRNHILVKWKACKPNYLGKTFARSGLEGCGDVNVISLVHRYLERIGAINFTCDVMNVSTKDQDNRICVEAVSGTGSIGSVSTWELFHGVS